MVIIIIRIYSSHQCPTADTLENEFFNSCLHVVVLKSRVILDGCIIRTDLPIKIIDRSLEKNESILRLGE